MSDELCAIEDCERPRCNRRGWCQAHYQRWRKHGTTDLPPPPRCSVEGCQRRGPYRHGRCQLHDYRWLRFGTTELPPKPSTYERFLSFVDASGGPDACHLWTGYTDPCGYGGFRDADSGPHAQTRAHRWLLGHLRGKPLTRFEYACHHCDNPPCVNPKHLYVGTPKSNMQDAIKRGRFRAGGRKPGPTTEAA